jgi:hypothetical protein
MSYHKEDEHNGAVNKERAARHALTGHAQYRIVEAAVEAPEVGPLLECWSRKMQTKTSISENKSGK